MGNPVTRFQMISQDPEATARFYSGAFGWTVNANNALGYRQIETGSDAGIAGGVWPGPQNFVQLFVEVEDVAAAVGKARALGAKVVIPASILPDGDEMAVLLDPLGMAFGVWRRAG
jgi:predicted enzyme related to lactoylglutathione lyase